MSKYRLTAYYSDKAKPPKEPGKEAFEVWATGESALSEEVTACSKREDIGRITIWLDTSNG